MLPKYSTAFCGDKLGLAFPLLNMFMAGTKYCSSFWMGRIDLLYACVYSICHLPSGLFGTNANNDKLIFK